MGLVIMLISCSVDVIIYTPSLLKKLVTCFMQSIFFFLLGSQGNEIQII